MTSIAFAGLTAAGKTTHAQRLAADLGYDYVSATDILFEILRVPPGRAPVVQPGGRDQRRPRRRRCGRRAGIAAGGPRPDQRPCRVRLLGAGMDLPGPGAP